MMYNTVLTIIVYIYKFIHTQPKDQGGQLLLAIIQKHICPQMLLLMSDQCCCVSSIYIELSLLEAGAKEGYGSRRGKKSEIVIFKLNTVIHNNTFEF